VDRIFFLLISLLVLSCSKNSDSPNLYQRKTTASLNSLTSLRAARSNALAAFAENVEGSERKCFYAGVSSEQDNGVLVRLHGGGDTLRWYLFAGNESSKKTKERVTASVPIGEPCPAIDVLVLASEGPLPAMSGVSLLLEDEISSSGVGESDLDCLYPDQSLPNTFDLVEGTEASLFFSEYMGGTKSAFLRKEPGTIATLSTTSKPSLTRINVGREPDWNCRAVGLLLMWWNK